MQTLAPIKDKLLSLCADSAHRVNSQSISETLQISPGHTRLVLKTVATVLHSESDPLATANPAEVDSVGVNVFDLVVFLYIQSYKRPLPKGHKDSAAVADVWPSTSAFDGFLSALSPLQYVVFGHSMLNLWTDQGSLLGIDALLGCPLHLPISKVSI